MRDSPLLDYRIKHFMTCELSIINLVWSKFVPSMIIIWLCGFLDQNFRITHFSQNQNSKLYPSVQKRSPPYILISKSKKPSSPHSLVKVLNPKSWPNLISKANSLTIYQCPIFKNKNKNNLSRKHFLKSHHFQNHFFKRTKETMMKG